MKGRSLITLVIIVTLLAGCKYETLEEAIKHDIPFNVKRVIYTEAVEDGEIIFYITEQEREKEPIEALAVAYMKKDEHAKWENVGNNHWEYKENSNMTVYENTFYDYNSEGNLERKIPLIYGAIHTKRIEKIEVEVERYKSAEAQIIENKYFINLGSYLAVKGIDSNGNIVEEYEKRD